MPINKSWRINFTFAEPLQSSDVVDGGHKLKVPHGFQILRLGSI